MILSIPISTSQILDCIFLFLAMHSLLIICISYDEHTHIFSHTSLLFASSLRGEANMARHKIAVISICSIVLLAMVVAVTVNFNKTGADADSDTNSKSAVGTSTSNKAIKDICRPTDYKKICEHSLSSEAGNATDPKELVKAAFKVTEREIRDAISKSTTLQNAAKDPSTADAFKICQEVLSDAMDDLYRSFEKFDISDMDKWDDYAYDLKIWLSGTVACQETCLDGFQNTTGDTGEKMKILLKNSRELTANALAIIDDLSKAYASLTGSKRRLLAFETMQESSCPNPMCNMFTKSCSAHPEDSFSTRRRVLSDEGSKHQNPFDRVVAFFSGKKSSNSMPVDETVYQRRKLLSEAPVGAPSEAPSGAPSEAPSGASTQAPSGAPGTTPVSAPVTPAGAPATPAGAPGTPAGTPAGAPAGAPAGTPAGAPAGAPAEGPASATSVPRVAIPDKSQANAIVAQDGSGNYTTIVEAVKAVPLRSPKPYVIYIKAGVYNEYVTIAKNMSNVVLMGDGPTQTKITGNKSVIHSGLKTYHTATVGMLHIIDEHSTVMFILTLFCPVCRTFLFIFYVPLASLLRTRNLYVSNPSIIS